MVTTNSRGEQAPRVLVVDDDRAVRESLRRSLEFNGYDKEIVGVIQGVIVLCVVIAYELVRRFGLGRQQRKVGEELAAASRQTDETDETDQTQEAAV